MNGDTIIYRPRKPQNDPPSKGDVCKCVLRGGGLTETFYAVVLAISADSVSVMKLYKDDALTSRYLIRDVGPTGLEYAMFVDSRIIKLSRSSIGMRVGRLSKMDLRNIRV